ncbi:MAG: inositol monophosphatase [Candidatus Terrybacteria bacterium]|nr:inositol monophosphatase [Candidatus Terrybacteria bacterium]
MNTTNYRDFSIYLVKEAGEKLKKTRNKKIEVSFKGEDTKDLITKVDIEINDFFVSEINKTFPEHQIYSEEEKFLDSVKKNQYEWALDPIDGTSNFSRNIPHFSTCVGLLYEEVPIAGAVYNPITNELFSFEKGKGSFLNDLPIRVSDVNKAIDAYAIFRIGHKEPLFKWGEKAQISFLASMKKVSNFGSSALDLCFLAAGRVDAVIYGTFTTRDVAAAIGILREAGGEIYTPAGQPAPLSKKRQTIIAAANRKLFEEIQPLSYLELLPPSL